MKEKAKTGRFGEYGKKYGKYGLCVTLGIVLYAAAEIAGNTGDTAKNGYLERNSYGGGDRQYELLVTGLENEEKTVVVTVPERRISAQEMQKEFPQIMECLRKEISGENESLLEVRSDLNLVRTLDEYGLSVKWESEDPEVISELGLLGTDIPETGKQVTLNAGIVNGTTITWARIPVKAFPAKRTVGEQFSRFLEEIFSKDLESREVALPESYSGQKLHYRSAEGGGNMGLIFLGMAAALCLFLKEKSEEKEKRKQWEERMILDYPELLSGFLVLTGAGYPVRQAWKKQVMDAEKKKQMTHHPVYREMQTTLNQMETGMPESRAYGEFGRRVGIGCYIKFASLLGNSVSTGGKDLRHLLEAEMETAFRQRKELALRKGEEASTKLLIPMFLMLGVVMVMVVAPAFLSL